jgi:hypothetical protein
MARDRAPTRIRPCKEAPGRAGDVGGVAGDFNCEGGVIRNRMGDQMSSTEGNRGEEGCREPLT